MQGFVVVLAACVTVGVIVCFSALGCSICKCSSDLPNKNIRFSCAASIGVTIS